MSSSKKKRLWVACQHKPKPKADPFYRKFDKRTVPNRQPTKGSR